VACHPKANECSLWTTTTKNHKSLRPCWMAQDTVQRLHGVGSRLELLESQEFDIVLVSSYLPDLYVGDFFERFHRLPVRPCVIVMQEGQAVKSLIGKELDLEE
jgi:hypothetical protein